MAMDSFPIQWIRVGRSQQRHGQLAEKLWNCGESRVPGPWWFSAFRWLVHMDAIVIQYDLYRFYSPVDMDLQDRWRKKLRNRAIQFTGHQFTGAIFFLTTRLSAWRRQYWVNFGFKLLLHFDFSDGGNYKEGLRVWLSPVPVACIFRHDAQDLDWALNCFCHILSSDSE